MRGWHPPRQLSQHIVAQEVERHRDTPIFCIHVISDKYLKVYHLLPSIPIRMVESDGVIPFSYAAATPGIIKCQSSSSLSGCSGANDINCVSNGAMTCVRNARCNAWTQCDAGEDEMGCTVSK